jgi:hypothetical protein
MATKKGRRTTNNSLPCSFCGNGFDPDRLIPIKTDRICRGCLHRVEMVGEEQLGKFPMKLCIEIEGRDRVEIQTALDEATRQYGEGYTSGSNANDSSQYRFGLYGQEDEEEEEEEES